MPERPEIPESAACTCRKPPEGMLGWDRGMIDRACPVHGHEALPELPIPSLPPPDRPPEIPESVERLTPLPPCFVPLPAQVTAVCDDCGEAITGGDYDVTWHFDAATMADPVKAAQTMADHGARLLDGRLWCAMCLDRKGIDLGA